MHTIYTVCIYKIIHLCIVYIQYCIYTTINIISQGRDPELTCSRLRAAMLGHVEQRLSLRADANFKFSRIPQGKT